MSERLIFATQGGPLSYHAVAAKEAAKGVEIEIEPHRRFGDVVRASRNTTPGLGVIAISTVAGTVEDSAKEIVRRRPSALPPIVARVDVPIELALIGSTKRDIVSLGRRGIQCLAQKPAADQCRDFISTHMPWVKVHYRGESTEAVTEAIAKNNPDYVAIGPKHCAEPLGGVLVGPNQINPVGSITSFYVLQRDPRVQLLPIDPAKYSPRTVVSLAHPEGEGEFDKCVDLIDRLGINVTRFIPFDIGDFTKHDPQLRRGGGILELGHDMYDEELTELCARVNGLTGNDGHKGPFNTRKLGRYDWYPEQTISLR